MLTEGRNWSIQKAGCSQELDKTISKAFVVAAGKSFSDEKKMVNLKEFLLRKAGLETAKKRKGAVGMAGLTKLQGKCFISKRHFIWS